MINFSKILNFIFIEECIECQKVGKLICNECAEKIKIASNIHNKNEENNLKHINWILSPLSYKNEILKQSLFYLKYKHVKSIAVYIADLVYIDFLKYIENNR